MGGGVGRETSPAQRASIEATTHRGPSMLARSALASSVTQSRFPEEKLVPGPTVGHTMKGTRAAIAANAAPCNTQQLGRRPRVRSFQSLGKAWNGANPKSGPLLVHPGEVPKGLTLSRCSGGLCSASRSLSAAPRPFRPRTSLPSRTRSGSPPRSSFRTLVLSLRALA